MEGLNKLYQDRLVADEERRTDEVNRDIQMLQAKAMNLKIKDCAQSYRNFYMKWGRFPHAEARSEECSVLVQVPWSQVRQRDASDLDAKLGRHDVEQATVEKAFSVVDRAKIERRVSGDTNQKLTITLVKSEERLRARVLIDSGCSTGYCYRIVIPSDVALKK